MLTLTSIKPLLGIDMGDTSQDASLSLYLEAGLEEARKYTTALDWNTIEKLPAGIRLGIAEWIKINIDRNDKRGIQSESIAGMSQTFRSDSETIFADVYRLWNPYRKKSSGMVFVAANRKGSVGKGVIGFYHPLVMPQ